jgi:hypothetical protein
MQDTSSAANHRRSDRAHRPNGLESDPSVGEETWFEAVPAPPADTPLIALIPVPRGESPTGGG